ASRLRRAGSAPAGEGPTPRLRGSGRCAARPEGSDRRPAARRRGRAGARAARARAPPGGSLPDGLGLASEPRQQEPRGAVLLIRALERDEVVVDPGLLHLLDPAEALLRAPDHLAVVRTISYAASASARTSLSRSETISRVSRTTENGRSGQDGLARTSRIWSGCPRLSGT